jgi:hypothetical protein
MRMDVIKEDVSIGKREVENRGLRVRSYMTERPVSETVELREEHVNVERRPVDRKVQGNEMDTFKEGTFEVRERTEEPVVRKEARVTEEVVINKTSDTRREEIHETARETHVDVEPLDEYRQDFEQRYATTGGNFDDYRPAYSFGHQRANDERYRNRQWEDAEQDLQREWETERPGTWNNYRDAARSSWDRNRTRSNRARMM